LSLYPGTLAGPRPKPGKNRAGNGWSLRRLVNAASPAWEGPRPHGSRNAGVKIQPGNGFAGGRAVPHSSLCLAALTMIKKALTAAFPLMVQDDRIAVQLAGVLWTSPWNATDSTDFWRKTARPAGGSANWGRSAIERVWPGLKRQPIQAVARSRVRRVTSEATATWRTTRKS